MNKAEDLRVKKIDNQTNKSLNKKREGLTGSCLD